MDTGLLRTLPPGLRPFFSRQNVGSVKLRRVNALRRFTWFVDIPSYLPSHLIA